MATVMTSNSSAVPAMPSSSPSSSPSTSPSPPTYPEIITTSPPETQHNHNQPPTRSRSRSSSLFHRNLLTRLRPLPFQYVFSLYHTKQSTSSRPTLLADSIPDIATFYKIYNNFPWSSLPLRDGAHFFRTGVAPLWEHPENIDGGAWVLKVRRHTGSGSGSGSGDHSNDRAIRTWEELCLMVCGGELQAVLSKEHDHILGLSYSPRSPHTAHISIWTKRGAHAASIDALQRTVLARLSEDLRPAGGADGAVEYYYKKHSDHEGWRDAVGALGRQGQGHGHGHGHGLEREGRGRMNMGVMV